MRAFPTFKPISKSTYPRRFYHSYRLPASKLGFISTFSHFPRLPVVEPVTSSSSKLVGFAFEIWARLHRVSLKRRKLDSMATVWAKIPYRNILSELAFLKNKIINYARMISRRKTSFEGLKCRGNPPFRSLEDQMSAVQSAVSSLFFWVGTLSKIIKVYHNRNFLFPGIYLYS